MPGGVVPSRLLPAATGSPGPAGFKVEVQLVEKMKTTGMKARKRCPTILNPVC